MKSIMGLIQQDIGNGKHMLPDEYPGLGLAARPRSIWYHDQEDLRSLNSKFTGVIT